MTAVRKWVSRLQPHSVSTKYASVIEYGGDCAGAYPLRRAVFLPWEVEEIVRGNEETFDHETGIMRGVVDDVLTRCAPAVKVSALEGTWYMRNQLLRDADWASMTHSVEVRVPLVDWNLWREVATLGLIAPYIGKRALAATPKKALPDAVVQRRKTGFTVPMREWMVEEEGARYAGRGLRGWARYVYTRMLDGSSSGVSNGCVRGAGWDRAVQSRSPHVAV